MSDQNEVRPPGFSFREIRAGRLRHSGTLSLYCEKVSLSTLAERYGTPLYVYSASAILARLAAFRRAFNSVPHTICYSVKANSNLNILRLLAKAGCGFDIVSGG